MKTVILVGFVAVVFGILLKALVPPPFPVSRDGSGPDALLAQFPLENTREVAYNGEKFTVKVPYHCNDGLGNIVIVVVDAAKVKKALAGKSDLTPALTTDGKALGQLWFMDYHNTGIGPYQEVVFTVFTGPALSCASTDAFCFSQAKKEKGHRTLVVDLWLDSNVAIAYGRDLFGMDKKKAAFDVEPVGDFGGVKFSGKGVATLTAVSPPTPLDFIGGLLRNVGVKGLFDAMLQPTQKFTVAGLKGIATAFPKDQAPEMQSELVTDLAHTVSLWNEGAGDRLVLENPLLKDLVVGPLATIHAPRVRFAMLGPHN